MNKRSKMFIIYICGVVLIGFMFYNINYSAIYSFAGDIFKDFDEDMVAVKLYKKALSRDKRNIKLRQDVIDIYRLAGDNENVLSELNDAIENMPEEPSFYLQVSRIMIDNNNILGAIKFLKGIDNKTAKRKVNMYRPDPPIFEPDPGFYDEYIEVTVYSDSKSYVSVDEYGYAEQNSPVTLDKGKTILSAVTVSEDGIISEATVGEYNLDRMVEPVIYKDKSVEAAVRSQIGRTEGQILTEDLWDIQEIHIDFKDSISPDIGDIIHFTNLKSIRLDNVDKIVSYAPLLELAHLEKIYVSGNVSPDEVEKFALMDSVRELTVIHGGLTEAPKLGDNIEVVNFSNNAIKKLDNLISGSIQELNLSHNFIDNIENIKNMPSLRVLDMSNNKIKEIDVIGALTELESINLSDNKIYDIKPLENIVGLINLDISRNIIDSIEPIKNMKVLENIDISYNNISDISLLENMGSIKMVFATGNEIDATQVFGDITIVVD